MQLAMELIGYSPQAVGRLLQDGEKRDTYSRKNMPAGQSCAAAGADEQLFDQFLIYSLIVSNRGHGSMYSRTSAQVERNSSATARKQRKYRNSIPLLTLLSL